MENWEISPPKHSARAWHIKTYMDLPYKNERNSWIGKIYQTRPKQSVFLGSKKHHLVKWVGFYHVFVKPPKNRRIAFFEVDGNALSWHVAGIAAWYCWWFRNPAHQLRLVVFFHCLQGFIHPRWLFGISSINSMDVCYCCWKRCERLTHTVDDVDGWNPAPADRYPIFLIGFYTSQVVVWDFLPSTVGSMYGIYTYITFAYICHENQMNAGKCTIVGSVCMPAWCLGRKNQAFSSRTLGPLLKHRWNESLCKAHQIRWSRMIGKTKAVVFSWLQNHLDVLWGTQVMIC